MKLTIEANGKVISTTGYDLGYKLLDFKEVKDVLVKVELSHDDSTSKVRKELAYVRRAMWLAETGLLPTFGVLITEG